MSDTSADLPPGAVCLAGFISPSEEAALVGHLDGGEWNSELRRRVQHFGYRYDYRARAVTAEAFLGALPAWLASLSERLAAAGFAGGVPDQVIANEYLPGQGISAHVDCVPCFDDTIVSISLLSRCEMVFRHRPSGATRAIILEPCSALVLTGAARYEWTHEIPARKSDIVEGRKVQRSRRISLTFRKVVRSI
ncbi:alpha-ketoglutarate-dependent dioxygenase AlkB [Hoeflea alexandrii]|uniref:alpha-ketoglutarate-dependent dioxygenase AlkB n=1 Tax=Hoeflea alexandrii TaxID=288436 RepID=UPI0022AF9271|nr:alpha-ketoglutarate-dependent dioxygenase AlkB [Hoeflea alexandrii]MCZ4290339.1 alpha-ketoglutarate-dependent dioxygenase AlkB [Hoeflea alexandrii]